MPSSYTSRLRLEQQAAGENLSTWGAPKLNNVISRIDFSIAGWTTIALTGDYTLTSSNSDDEARSAMLKFTGTGAYTVTIPAVGKRYDIWNALSGVLTVSAGGTAATLQAGEKVSVICDGAAVYRVQPTDFGSQRITSVADPTGAQDAATRAYVDAQAWAVASGNLPAQSGAAGKFLQTDGTDPAWVTPTVTDIQGAAPADAPSFTGGVTLTGGVDQTGSTKANVQAAAALDLDLSAADFFTKSISAGSAFTFSNATAAKAQAFVLELTISSAAVPTWPASVTWGGGVDPSSALGNGRHVIGFVTFDGGTTWTGLLGAVAAA